MLCICVASPPLVPLWKQKEKMAINQLAAALVLTVISGSVLADEPSSPAVSSASSGASKGLTPASAQAAPKTRAQVIAELQQARANGEMNISDASYPGPDKFVSRKTRAQVRTELEQARANGELNQSDAGYPATPPAVAGKTRAQVIAELKAFQAVHGMNGLYRDY
jgi:hypothetical protein